MKIEPNSIHVLVNVVLWQRIIMAVSQYIRLLSCSTKDNVRPLSTSNYFFYCKTKNICIATRRTAIHHDTSWSIQRKIVTQIVLFSQLAAFSKWVISKHIKSSDKTNTRVFPNIDIRLLLRISARREIEIKFTGCRSKLMNKI